MKFLVEHCERDVLHPAEAAERNLRGQHSRPGSFEVVIIEVVEPFKDWTGFVQRLEIVKPHAVWQKSFDDTLRT